MELQRRGRRRRRHRRRQQDARRLVHPRARHTSSSTTTATASATPARRRCPQFALTVRERDNSLMDQYTNTVTTDDSRRLRHPRDLPARQVAGPRGVQHPLPDHRRHLPGRERDRRATTQLGGLVDLNFLPIIGLGGEIDWGVQPYAAGDQRRHRRHGHLRHDPQRARPGRRGHRGLPARHPGRARSTSTRRVPCTATTAEDKANACRQGKEIVPLQVPNPTRRPTPAADDHEPRPGPRRARQGPGAAGRLHLARSGQPPRGCTARQYDGPR